MRWGISHQTCQLINLNSSLLGSHTSTTTTTNKRTSIFVYLIERILGHGEHSNVGPKLLDEVRNHIRGVGGGRDAHTLRGHLLARVLKVETHHTVELEVLEHKERKKGQQQLDNWTINEVVMRHKTR